MIVLKTLAAAGAGIAAGLILLEGGCAREVGLAVSHVAGKEHDQDLVF